ncbi:TPA: hypothetical protein ACK3O9_007386, partial [Burkholderia cepacia]
MFIGPARFVKDAALGSRPFAQRDIERYVTSRRALRRLTGTSQPPRPRTEHARRAKAPLLRLNRADIPDSRNKARHRFANAVVARNLQRRLGHTSNVEANMHTLFKKTTVTMAVSSLLALYGCGSVDGPTTPPTIKPSTSGTG